MTEKKKKFTFGVGVTLLGIAIHLFVSYSADMMALGEFYEKEKGVYKAIENSATKQELKDTAMAIRRDIPILFSTRIDSLFKVQ